MSRRADRRTALVLLYQWDVTGQELASLFEGDVPDFSRKLAEDVVERHEELDARITAAADDWTISPTVATSALYETGALRALFDVVRADLLRVEDKGVEVLWQLRDDRNRLVDRYFCDVLGLLQPLLRQLQPALKKGDRRGSYDG